MRPLAATLASLSFGTLSFPVLAHHSAAMFDPSREITARGMVKTWEWTNPHSWLTVLVDDGHGKSVALPLELGSPNTLFRSGWRDSTFKTGDNVTVLYHPRRDGNPGGALVEAVTAAGQRMTWLPSATKSADSPAPSAPAGSPRPPDK